MIGIGRTQSQRVYTCVSFSSTAAGCRTHRVSNVSCNALEGPARVELGNKRPRFVIYGF